VSKCIHQMLSLREFHTRIHGNVSFEAEREGRGSVLTMIPI